MKTQSPFQSKTLSPTQTPRSHITLQRLAYSMQSTYRSISQSRFVNPPLLAIYLLVIAAIYIFIIGRNRYTATSEFVIRQPLPPSTTGSSLLSPTLGSPSILGSLEDGRYLQVYLSSPEVMKRIYPDISKLQLNYNPEFPDIFSGLPKSSNSDYQLYFFRRQQSVVPHELSGVIVLTTTGFTSAQAFALNKSLLQQAQLFVNSVNQGISNNQLLFAEKEVAKARQRLTNATNTLNAFQDQHGQLNAISEKELTSNFITSLESRLVDLKVQEATLRRQFRDPQAPEVTYVSDQARELQRQIAEERRNAVSSKGRDLNEMSLKLQNLQNEVAFASEALKSSLLASDNSRIESQRQIKYLVMLQEPRIPSQPNQSWRFQAFFSVIGILIVIWGVGGFLVGVSRRQ